MKKLKIKGTIISNDEKWVYDLFDMDSTAPKDIDLPDDDKPISVEINSGGGDVFAGSEIYTALKSYEGKVNVKITGIAASAASIIAMAGSKVSISPTAQLMIHNVSSAVQGDHRTLGHESKVLRNYNSSIAKAYVDKTGKDMDELLELMGEETWFTADEAVKQGFADEVMFAKKETPKMVASASPVIPEKVIKGVASMKMQHVDINDLTNQVAKKLRNEDEPSEEDKTVECPNCGYEGKSSEFESDEEGKLECPDCGYVGDADEFKEVEEESEEESSDEPEETEDEKYLKSPSDGYIGKADEFEEVNKEEYDKYHENDESEEPEEATNSAFSRFFF